MKTLLTIQIHLLNIRDTEFTRVPKLAIWIPETIGKDIIRQPKQFKDFGQSLFLLNKAKNLKH